MASCEDKAMSEECSAASCEDEVMSEEPSIASAIDSATREQFPPAQSLDPEERERVKQKMLERLSTTSAHFAHRQRDAPDLTPQEKVDIAAGILDRSPATFLARFGKFLQASDLPYFQGLDRESYEIAFHLKDIEHRCSHQHTIVKNRRFSAMRELEEGGVYFSEDEMKHREPLLYEQMIGRYLTVEERQQKVAESIDRTDLRFSSILLTHLDIVRERELYRYQKEKEECQEEEEEEDSEEEEDDDEEEENREQKNRKKAMEEDEEEEEEVEEDVPEICEERVSDIVRQQLRDEFKAIMQEKFLSGADAQFDYSKVDDNPDYDSLLMEAQDEENKYFLSEDPLTIDRDMGSDSDRDSGKCSVTAAATTTAAAGAKEEEEEEDYMMYVPSAELVAKSARFVRTGAWTEMEKEEDGEG